jgi:pellino protein
VLNWAGNEGIEVGGTEETHMLTADQATAVAEYLIAHTPGASGELDHSHISAWQMSCEALEALGYATETARGALLRPTPALPAILPRWDDAACVVLSAAEQTGGIRLRHPRSDPTDETGPSTADPETATLLALLGLISGGGWTDAAVPVLWRTAPEEAPPLGEEAFSAQVEQVVTGIPDAIRDQIHAIYAEHANETVRDYLVDWVFFEGWRWGDGWVTGERGGRLLEVFHDQLAQKVRAAVVARLLDI